MSDIILFLVCVCVEVSKQERVLCKKIDFLKIMMLDCLI